MTLILNNSLNCLLVLSPATYLFIVDEFVHEWFGLQNLNWYFATLLNEKTT